jgi:GNAT superfamily N-acetyltransferase
VHVIELDHYDRARPLFAGLAEMHLNVTAVLKGDCPGKVYVDNLDTPRAALLVTGDGYYLAGDTQNQAFNAAVNAFLPRDDYFVLFCDIEVWGPALDTILKHTYAVRAGRRYHTFQQPRMPDWQARIPEGFSVQRVDAALLSRELEHGDEVVEGIAAGWQTTDLFLQRGFGYCTVHQDTIASWSLVDYVDGARCEIGVNTAWDYRRRGLGSLATAATAAHATTQGFRTIGWHCWANNVGSIGVAEKVGFVQAATYDIWINHWAAENVTDMTQDEFRAFAERYKRWFEAEPPTSGYPHLVAATAWALARERGQCYVQLNRAVDVGWLRSVAQLREHWPEFFWNPHLEQIEEWKALRARLEGV